MDCYLKYNCDCCHAGVKDILKNLSEKQGKKMNSPESAKDIPKFLELFKVQSITKPFSNEHELKLQT